MDWFELLVDVYMVFLAVAIVCYLWLLWSSHKLDKKLEQLDREKEARFRKFRMVEKQFIKA